eukprot:jgi/Bigna1/137858/aug1.41_g12566
MNGHSDASGDFRAFKEYQFESRWFVNKGNCKWTDTRKAFHVPANPLTDAPPLLDERQMDPTLRQSVAASHLYPLRQREVPQIHRVNYKIAGTGRSNSIHKYINRRALSSSKIASRRQVAEVPVSLIRNVLPTHIQRFRLKYPQWKAQYRKEGRLPPPKSEFIRSLSMLRPQLEENRFRAELHGPESREVISEAEWLLGHEGSGFGCFEEKDLNIYRN